MSNEERLEKIISSLNLAINKNIVPNLNIGDLNWLVARAELSADLERKYENTGSMFGRQAQRTLIDENKRLHEALVIAYSHCDDNLMDETIDVIRMALDGDDVKEIWADELVKGYRALEDNS